MGGEIGEVGDGVGEDGEVGDRVDGVILSSSSRKFVGDEDRKTECAERGRMKETKIRENDRDISPDQPVSVGTSRIKSR